MNQKGQAAVTDALYFLMIVTFLSIFLFGFANSYGNSVKQQINDEFTVTFATNALKTILYTSTTRDPGASINDPDAEIDYLVAILKEDFADDQIISESTRKVLGKTISRILSPIEDNLDYIFIITTAGDGSVEKEIVFMYVHTTNFVEEAVDIQGRGYTIYHAGNPAEGTPSHYNFFCALDSGAIDHSEDSTFESFFKDALTRLVSNIGSTSEASAKIKLSKISSSGELDRVDAQADLIMWDALWLGTTDDRLEGLFYAETPLTPLPSWNCSEPFDPEADIVT